MSATNWHHINRVVNRSKRSFAIVTVFSVLLSFILSTCAENKQRASSQHQPETQSAVRENIPAQPSELDRQSEEFRRDIGLELLEEKSPDMIVHSLELNYYVDRKDALELLRLQKLMLESININHPKADAMIQKYEASVAAVARKSAQRYLDAKRDRAKELDPEIEKALK